MGLFPPKAGRLTNPVRARFVPSICVFTSTPLCCGDSAGLILTNSFRSSMAPKSIAVASLRKTSKVILPRTNAANTCAITWGFSTSSRRSRTRTSVSPSLAALLLSAKCSAIKSSLSVAVNSGTAAKNPATFLKNSWSRIANGTLKHATTPLMIGTSFSTVSPSSSTSPN